MRGTIIVVAAFLTLATTTTAARAADPIGALSAPTGPAGCITQDGSSQAGAGDCTDGRGLVDSAALALSPDERFAYVQGNANVAILARDAATGALSQLPGPAGCVSNGGADDCGSVHDLPVYVDSGGIAVSGDGRFLYVAGEDSIAVFGRDLTTGALTQLAGTSGCITPDGNGTSGAGTCANGRGVADISSLLLSPRAGNPTVFVGQYNTNHRGLAVFARNETTGALTQLPGAAGCVTNTGGSEEGAATCTVGRGVNYPGKLGISPGGAWLYVPGYDDGAVAIFAAAADGTLTQPAGTAGCWSRTGSNGCADSRYLSGPYSVAVSPDGRSVYVGNYDDPDGIAVFRRDVVTGALSEIAGTAGCVSSDGSDEAGPGGCGDGRGTQEMYNIAVSPDGLSVYTSETNGIGAYSRDASTGALTQLPGTFGCLSFNGGPSVLEAAGACATQRLTAGAGAFSFSADGRDLYHPDYAADGLTWFRRALPVPAGPGPGTPPVVPAPRPVADTVAASCRPRGTARVRNIRKGVLRVTLRCDEAARVTGELLVSQRQARRVKLAAVVRRRIGRGTVRATKAGPVTLRITLTKKARTRIRRIGARRVKALDARLRVTTVDAAGNRSRRTLKLTLR